MHGHGTIRNMEVLVPYRVANRRLVEKACLGSMRMPHSSCRIDAMLLRGLSEGRPVFGHIWRSRCGGIFLARAAYRKSLPMANVGVDLSLDASATHRNLGLHVFL